MAVVKQRQIRRPRTNRPHYAFALKSPPNPRHEIGVTSNTFFSVDSVISCKNLRPHFPKTVKRILHTKCPLLSPWVTSCPPLSHSNASPNRSWKNPCYNNGMNRSLPRGRNLNLDRNPTPGSPLLLISNEYKTSTFRVRTGGWGVLHFQN